MDDPPVTPAIAIELRRLLLAAGITQYQLRQAGMAPESARIVLGLRDGLPSLTSADLALSLLKPPRQLWHRRRQ